MLVDQELEERITKLNRRLARISKHYHSRTPAQHKTIGERNEVIRELLLRGKSQRAIANLFGICQQTVQQVKNSLPAEDKVRMNNGSGFKSIHGHTSHVHKSPTYKSWDAMLGRAENKNGEHPTYANVTVCDRWNPKKGGSFQNFLSDMKERPEDCTIGRAWDMGDYDSNLGTRWMTRAEQHEEARKKRELRKWAKQFNVPIEAALELRKLIMPMAVSQPMAAAA